jgi:hypothetical protein
MNKAERHRIKMLRYRRRLRNLGLKGEHNCYRTTGKPCSCAMCDQHKWPDEKHTHLRRQPIEE